MLSRSLVLGLLAAGCITAAGAGAYVAVRQNSVEPPSAAAVAAPLPAQQAVAETEALVAPPSTAPPEVDDSAAGPPRGETRVEREKVTASRREGTRNGRAAARTEPRTARPRPAAAPPAAAAVEQRQNDGDSVPTAPEAAVEAVSAPPAYVEPLAPPAPRIEEVTVPASAVIGLQVETAISSERAQVEDRVGARVTRDVMAGGRVAIPAGSRVLGAVTLVERGGKVKERARLGVRFHTLVLADGSELPLRTETIFREGESPARDSSRKIGGAAVGGAILGAILGGGKGAVTGGAIGAAGGTAAVMAGERQAAALPTGAILTVRLSAPVDVEIERR